MAARTSGRRPRSPSRSATTPTLTIVRTNVDIKPDMCIWRGAVEGTGAPATLMWWPGGKMAGTVQHEGRIYSIRHMGGEMHAVVEMAEDRMPQEHAPMPERMRANDPNLRDDPLVQAGRRQHHAADDAGHAAAASAAGTSKKKQQQAEAGRPRRGSEAPRAAAKTAKAARRPDGQGHRHRRDRRLHQEGGRGNYADVKRELVELAIEEANESFRMSNLGHVKLRLVHAYQTDYVEEGAHFDHVWRFADKGDGYMEEIHGLRDKYRADVAILIVDDRQGLRARHPRLCRRRRGVRRRAPRMRRRDLHAGARDRPHHRRPARPRRWTRS